MEKSRSENQIEFLNVKREKSKIKSKINLIYNWKMKSDVIERNIGKKTRILTRDSAQNDPIDCRIKGFHFAISKTIVRIQEAISPYSLHEISLSDTSWMQKLI